VDPFTGATVDANSNYGESKAARLASSTAIVMSRSPLHQLPSAEYHDTSTLYGYLSTRKKVIPEWTIAAQPTSDTLSTDCQVEVNLALPT